MDSNPSNTKGRASDRDELTELMRDVQHRLQRLDERMDKLEGAVTQGRDISGIALDVFDDHVAGLRARGVDMRDRSGAVLKITEDLTNPELLGAIHKLTGKTDQMIAALQAIEGLPGLAAIGIDAFDGMLARVQKRGIDIDARAQALSTAMEHLSSPAAVATLESLFGPGDAASLTKAVPLENPILQLLIDVSESIREAAAEPPKRTGLIGVLRAGADEDIKTLTSFAINFGRAFGRKLAAVPTRPLPASHVAPKLPNKG